MKTVRFVAIALIAIVGSGCQKAPKEIERPEKVVSLRQVLYDSSTYARLAQLWKNYYDEYPSEEAYGNWMYATGYAAEPGEQYESQLKKGLDKYPSDPTLLYLLGKHKTTRGAYVEGVQLLEKSAELDQRYAEPWFSLVVAYLSRGDREKADVALRRILESGAVQDEVMDFSYNMLAGLEPNAILIVNGDNDTFPGWILTRIAKFRPDVCIVNRSLLNTEWYPLTVVNDGVPQFTTKAVSDSLSKQMSYDFKQAKEGKMAFSDVATLGDRLVARIVDAAQRVGRPVYIACTVGDSKLLKDLAARGRELGLTTMVTLSPRSYESQCRDLLGVWVKSYRTGGIDSWRIRYEKGAPAGRMLIRNYAQALYSFQPSISAAGEDTQLSLFRWYRDHLLDVLPDEVTGNVNGMWCSKTAPREIREWCTSRGISR
jgi:tetratricopeptide (TPR) repeat protein